MSVHPVGAQSPGGCWAIAGGATSWCCPPPSLTLSSGGGDCDPAWRVKVGSGALFYSPTLIVSNFPTLILLSYSLTIPQPSHCCSHPSPSWREICHQWQRAPPYIALHHPIHISHTVYFTKYITSAHVYFTMPSQARVGTHPSVNCSKLPFAIP